MFTSKPVALGMVGTRGFVSDANGCTYVLYKFVVEFPTLITQDHFGKAKSEIKYMQDI